MGSQGAGLPRPRRAMLRLPSGSLAWAQSGDLVVGLTRIGWATEPIVAAWYAAQERLYPWSWGGVGQ